MLSEKTLSFLKKVFYNRRITWHKQNFKLLSGCRKIVDIGCGKGLFIKFSPAKIIGVDYNCNSLKECVNLGYSVIRGNVLNLPFSDQSFDGVHCADIIEHFPPRDVRSILSEISRVLKVGGLALIATPMPSEIFWNDASHIRPYPPMALLSYFIPDKSKGLGTQPTQESLPYEMKLVKFMYRYAQLYQLPLQLYLPQERLRWINLLRPSTLWFVLANFLSRIGINFPRPEGYVLVLKKA